MRKTIVSILFGIFIAAMLQPSATANNQSTSVDSLTYVQYTHDRQWFFITIEASCEDSVKGLFFVDTGISVDMLLDSAFFHKNFQADKFKQFDYHNSQGVKHTTIYEGELKLQIGDLELVCNVIEVQDFSKTFPDAKFIGALGHKLFEDRITIFDINNRRVAFTNTLDIDTSYVSVPFKSARQETKIEAFRYIEIDGFKDKNNAPIKSLFLFDTGCVGVGFSFKTSFANNLSNPIREERFGFSRDVSGKEQILVGKMDSVFVGSYEIKDVRVDMQKDNGTYNYLEETLKGADGLFGFSAMTRFNMIIDYRRNVLYLKPSIYFNRDTIYYTHPEELIMNRVVK